MSEALPAVFIMGPTASGKTDLAIALAERYRCALINVDSAQVYRRLNIGAAKPSAEELARAPHALLDIREPWQNYTVGEFCKDAAALIAQARDRGELPVLVGGSMMYFRALQFGLSELPSSEPETRALYQAQLSREGLPALRQQLQAVDPVSAARIEPADTQRTLRALEVWHDTARTLSDWQQQPAVPVAVLDVLALALWPEPRAVLHQRIAQRFDAMLDAGLVDEVAQLRAMPEIDATLSSMRSVGYRQIYAHLDGHNSLDEARELGIIATRQLAKRQYTWLRRWPGAHYLNPLDESSTVVAATEDLIKKWRPNVLTTRNDA